MTSSTAESMKQGSALSAKVALLINAGAAIVPPIYYGITIPAMNHDETVAAYGIFFSALIVGPFIAYRKPLAGLLGLPLVVLVLSAVVWHSFAANREARLAPLREAVSPLLELKFAPARPKAEPAELAPPKVLVLDRQSRQIDPVQFLLPQSIQPSTRNEIHTVAYLDWAPILVGEYGTGGKAFRRTCNVQLVSVDPPAHIVAEAHLEGGDPPARGKEADLFGPPPYDDLIAFILRHGKS